LYLEHIAVRAHAADPDTVSRRSAADQALRVPVVPQAFAVDVREDVAGLNARRRRRADDAGDLNGPTVDTVSACSRRRQRHGIHHYPDVTPYYAAVLDELLRHSPNEIDGNRKADTLGRAFAAALGHRGVDADQLAARVHEGAAGVARIDRGVCLDEVLV